MEYESFEQSLKVCMKADDRSDEQKKAMVFCLEHAPADLRTMLEKRLKITGDHQHGAGCGCAGQD